MRILHGDIWSVGTDFVCICTNGTAALGAAIMGAGTALQAKQRHPDLPKLLALKLHQDGLHTYILKLPVAPDLPGIVALPTEVEWWTFANEGLICRSLGELRLLADDSADTFALPLPGAGAGGVKSERARQLVVEAELPENVYLVLGGKHG